MRLRLGLSHLREHKFKHIFQDSINPLCFCSLDSELTIDYLFQYCPLFTTERHTRLNTISQIQNKLLDSVESNLTQHLLLVILPGTQKKMQKFSVQLLIMS